MLLQEVHLLECIRHPCQVGQPVHEESITVTLELILIKSLTINHVPHTRGHTLERYQQMKKCIRVLGHLSRSAKHYHPMDQYVNDSSDISMFDCMAKLTQEY